jgi:hypothetical protein
MSMTAIKPEKPERKRKILFLSLVRKWNLRLRKYSKRIPPRTAGMIPNGGGCGAGGGRASMEALHMKTK